MKLLIEIGKRIVPQPTEVKSIDHAWLLNTAELETGLEIYTDDLPRQARIYNGASGAPWQAGPRIPSKRIYDPAEIVCTRVARALQMPVLCSTCL